MAKPLDQNVISIHQKSFSCGSNFGHPVIYLTFTKNNVSLSCPYCGQKYKYTRRAQEQVIN